MKFTSAIIAGLAATASAFPAAMYEAMVDERAASESLESIKEAVVNFEKRQTPFTTPGFNAAQQYVSNKGDHKFVPPVNVNTFTGDQRGPCPGLNAMANHGYLPHNGIATIQQFIDGTYKVFGMGKDLGAFLAVYGAIVDGSGTAWSIGGPSSQLIGIPNLGLLSIPQGISGSHNKYEGDVSPSRGDLYQYKDTYKVVLSQFKELFARQPNAATANYNLDVLTDFRATRFQQSISQNPYFFNAPFSGVAVQPAAYTFIFRFMGNKSAEHPTGYLNQEVLKSFFAISGDYPNFTWKEGWEAIPDNWYKRAIGDEYTIPYFNLDLGAAALKYPQFLAIGGNTGTVNSFTGIDPANLSGGLYNARTLAQGNNALCFAYQFQQQIAGDLIKGLFLSDATPLGQLRAAFDKAFGGLGCPQLESIDRAQFAAFPGAKGAY